MLTFYVNSMKIMSRPKHVRNVMIFCLSEYWLGINSVIIPTNMSSGYCVI